MDDIDYDIDDDIDDDDDIFHLQNVENADKDQHQCYLMNFFILYPCSSFFELLITALCNQKLTEMLKLQVKDNCFLKFIKDKFSSDPKMLGKELIKIERIIAFPRKIDFFNLDEEEAKREKIIEIVEKQFFHMHRPVIFHSEGIPSNFDYPCQVLGTKMLKNLDLIKNSHPGIYKKCLKRANNFMNVENQDYYVISFIIGAKNRVPVLVMINQETKLEYYGMKVSENKTEIIKSKEEIPTFIDTIYLLFYQFSDNNHFEDCNSHIQYL